MRIYVRSLWDASCDLLAAGIIGVVFWLSKVPPCGTCGDPYCEEQHS